MIKAVRPVLQVLLAVVFMESALSILSPLIGLQLARDGVATEIIGFVASAYFAGFLLGTLSCHYVIDRVGHIRAFAVFAALAANATLLHAIWHDEFLWLALRAISGYAVAGLFVIIESWLNDKATSENRGRVFSLYMIVSWAASGSGALGLNLDDPDGFLLFSLASMLFATALIPMALTRVGNPEIGHREHFGIYRLFRISPTGVTVAFGSGLVNTGLYALLPAYTESLNFTTAELSIIWTASTIAGLVIQFPIGWLSDHFGRRPLMVASASSAAAIAVVIATLPDPAFWPLLILLFVLEGLAAPLYALAIGQTNDYVSKKDFVAASAGLLFAWGLGAAIGPVLGGFVMAPLGPRGLFVFQAVSLGLLAAFVVIRMILRRALSPKDQSNYVAVPQTQGTYGAPELDPRGEPESHPHKLPDE